MDCSINFWLASEMRVARSRRRMSATGILSLPWAVTKSRYSSAIIIRMWPPSVKRTSTAPDGVPSEVAFFPSSPPNPVVGPNGIRATRISTISDNRLSMGDSCNARTEMLTVPPTTYPPQETITKKLHHRVREHHHWDWKRSEYDFSMQVPAPIE